MTLINTRMRRFVAVGAFAVLAAAAPAIFAATAPQAGTEVNFGPACLAWFGNKEDGKCLSYSNGSPSYIGTPWVGAGPSGVITGPLMPGTTINQGIR